MNEWNPYFQGPKLSGVEYEWLIDAIHHVASNGLLEEEFPDLPQELQNEEPDALGRRFNTAAWCLREIAKVAIQRLDQLPVEAQQSVCAHSEAWPVMLRPKVSTSAKRAGVRVTELGLGTKLPIDLNHSTASESGEKVPIQESIWPGIGLAARLHDVLEDFRLSGEMAGSAFADYPVAEILVADPEQLAESCEAGNADGDGPISSGESDAEDRDESAMRQEEEEAFQRMRTKFGRQIHREFLVATLPPLTQETARHWALAAIRHLQAENDGFLVHDVCSSNGGDWAKERLSPWIPREYWENIKQQVVTSPRNAMRSLENRVESALRSGFQKLAR
jgi:hypothetical protein